MFGGPSLLKNIKYIIMCHCKMKNLKIFSTEGPRETASLGLTVALDGPEHNSGVKISMCPSLL